MSAFAPCSNEIGIARNLNAMINRALAQGVTVLNVPEDTYEWSYEASIPSGGSLTRINLGDSVVIPKGSRSGNAFRNYKANFVVSGGKWYGGRKVTGWGVATSGNTSSAVWDRLPTALKNAGSIVKAHLPSCGITDYGSHETLVSAAAPTAPPIRLYCVDRPMTYARWPDDDWATGDRHASTRTILENCPTLPSVASYTGVMLYGSPERLYKDYHAPVSGLSGTTLTLGVTLAADSDGLTTRPFYLYNAPEFLSDGLPDQCYGSFWVDTATGWVYACFEGGALPMVEVWADAGPNVGLYCFEVAGFRVTGAEFRYWRAEPIKVQGSNGSSIDLNTFTCCQTGVRHYRSGAVVNSGVHIDDNVFSWIQGSAIRGSWGTRKTLTAAGATINRNTIDQVGLWHKAHYPIEFQANSALSADANAANCGVEVSYNEIANTPANGIFWAGAYIDIHHNTLDGVCNHSTDQGAIYCYGPNDPTSTFYSKVRQNTIINTWQRIDHGNDNNGVRGIYLDTFASGVAIFQNKITNCDRAVQINGGWGCALYENTVTLPETAMGGFGSTVKWLVWNGWGLPLGGGGSTTYWKFVAEGGTIDTNFAARGAAWATATIPTNVLDLEGFPVDGQTHKLPELFVGDEVIYDPLERALEDIISVSPVADGVMKDSTALVPGQIDYLGVLTGEVTIGEPSPP